MSGLERFHCTGLTQAKQQYWNIVAYQRYLLQSRCVCNNLIAILPHHHIPQLARQYTTPTHMYHGRLLPTPNCWVVNHSKYVPLPRLSPVEMTGERLGIERFCSSSPSCRASQRYQGTHTCRYIKARRARGVHTLLSTQSQYWAVTGIQAYQRQRRDGDSWTH